MDMNPFTYLFDREAAASAEGRKDRVVEYIRTTPSVNEEDESGDSLLTLAISLQLFPDCEHLAAELLDRGADPNRPSPMGLLLSLLLSSKMERTPLPLLAKLIEKGMELNNVYAITDRACPSQGPSTLLDYLDASLEGLSPK